MKNKVQELLKLMPHSSYKLHFVVYRDMFTLIYLRRCQLLYCIDIDHNGDCSLREVNRNTLIAMSMAAIKAALMEPIPHLKIVRYCKTKVPQINKVLRECGLTCPKLRSRKSAHDGYYYNASALSVVNGEISQALLNEIVVTKINKMVADLGLVCDNLSVPERNHFSLRFRDAQNE